MIGLKRKYKQEIGQWTVDMGTTSYSRENVMLQNLTIVNEYEACIMSSAQYL